MDLDPARLRKGELIVGAGAVVLLASMFALSWYGLNSVLAPTAARLGASVTVNGWDGLTHLRWLMLITIVVALALVFFQVTRRAPAVPVTFSVIVTVFALITTLALIYRVLINPPGSGNAIDQKAGAFVGLVAAVVILVGGYLSMRQEGILERDGPGEIETISLQSPGGS